MKNQNSRSIQFCATSQQRKLWLNSYLLHQQKELNAKNHLALRKVEKDEYHSIVSFKSHSSFAQKAKTIQRIFGWCDSVKGHSSD